MDGQTNISPASSSSGGMTKVILLAGGAAVATYIATLAIKQYKLLNDTCFKPAGFVKNKLTLNDADINIKLQIKNKSQVQYFIKSQQYNILINNNFVGVIKNPNRIPVPPSSPDKVYSDVWLNVKFDPSKVANLSWVTLQGLLLGNGGDVTIQIQGAAKVTDKLGLFTYNYPVNQTFTLKDLTSGGASSPC